MSFDKVITAPFKNGGFVRLIIGGLLEFIPIIGWLFVSGYMLKCYEHGTAGRDEMPEWSQWGQKLADGFMVILVSLIYMIVPLLFLPTIIRFVEYGMRGYFDFSMIVIPALLCLVFCFSIPMALSNYAVNRTFVSAFNLGYIFKLIAARPGSYIGAFFLYWFACLITFIFVIFVPIVGWLFSIFSGFYLSCVSGLLFGSVYKRAVSSVNGVKPAGPVLEKGWLCPRCGEETTASAKFCKKCGAKIDDLPVTGQKEIAASSEDALKCPGCGRKAISSDKFCKSCGDRIDLAANKASSVVASLPTPVQAEVPESVRENAAPVSLTAVEEAVPETTHISSASVETTVLRLEDDKFPILQPVNGEDAILVDKIEFILGRDGEKCDYTFSETVIGRMHAKLISLGGYFIVDLNSKNGTYVNDKRIESNVSCELKDGDRIRFANKEYILKV